MVGKNNWLNLHKITQINRIIVSILLLTILYHKEQNFFVFFLRVIYVFKVGFCFLFFSQINIWLLSCLESYL